MPRKEWTPKCCYIRRTKLSDAQFECITLSFLMGANTANARAVMADTLEGKPPSDKSVLRIYELIGLRLFEDWVEPQLLVGNSRLFELKENDPAKYETEIDQFCGNVHKLLIHHLDDESLPKDFLRMFAPLVRDYQYLSSVKNGIAGRVRGNLGLSALWNIMRNRIDPSENKYKSGYDEGVMLSTYLMVLGGFKEKPL